MEHVHMVVERILSQNVYVWFSEVYLSPQVDFEEIDIFTASFVGQPKDGVEIWIWKEWMKRRKSLLSSNAPPSGYEWMGNWSRSRSDTHRYGQRGRGSRNMEEIQKYWTNKWNVGWQEKYLEVKKWLDFPKQQFDEDKDCDDDGASWCMVYGDHKYWAGPSSHESITHRHSPLSWMEMMMMARISLDQFRTIIEPKFYKTISGLWLKKTITDTDTH